MTWDLDGQDESRLRAQINTISTKSPENIVRSLVFVLETLRDLEEKESMSKVGWVKISNIKDTLRRLLIPQ